MPIKRILGNLAGVIGCVFLLASIAAGTAIPPTRAPTPTSYHYGDLDGDSAITTIDSNILLNLLNGKAYTIGALQPDNPNQDWNTCDIDSDMACTTMDKNIYLDYLTGKEVDIDDKPWVISVPNLQANIYTVGLFVPFNANISSKNGTIGRAGVAVTATIHPIGDGFGSTATGHMSGRLCDPNTDGDPNQPTVLGVDDQCALAVTITDWHNFPALGLTESGQYGMAVEGDAPGTIAIELAIQDNGLGVPAITTTICTHVADHSPTWSTTPTNISLPVGSTYNHTDGTAMDIDTGQTLSCSLISSSCSFGVTVSGSGPNTGVNCSISFASGNTTGSCTVAIQVSDGAGGNLTASINIVVFPPVSAISAGFQHNCVITTAGGVKCWGLNSYGQLGDNTTISRHTAVDVVGLSSGVVAITGGGYHTCALTTAGGVKCWGYNYDGELGDNTSTDHHTPVDVYGLSSGVASISAGFQHTCALTTAGGVKCWGLNNYGQLGDNSTTSRHTPVDVVGLSTGVAAISGGGYHTCALTTAGGVKCWGYNYYGEIGDNTTTNRKTPVDVVGLSSGVAAISGGGYHTCALTTAGGVKCWGQNTYGQIGDNTTADRHTPVDVVGLSNGVSAISAGWYHTSALTTAGGAKCWGFNYYGELGDNTTTNRYTPVVVVGLSSGVSAISPGGYHTCALMPEGEVKCWGYNYDGEIGDNTSTNRLSPVDVVWPPDAPTWQTSPSNISKTSGSIYNQTNGTAQDADIGQTVTCSNNGTSCGFTVNVSGSGANPQNCNINFTAPIPVQTCNLRITVTDNGSPAMSVGATISITIINRAPTWSTAPTNITITGGSVYNQTNGTAIDIDTSQNLTCSINGTSCSFAITISGSGANPQNCNVSFTALSPTQTCNLRVQVADNGSPSLTVGQTITITITGNHIPGWSAAPSNIAIPVGSAYNQANGVATDIDTGQTLSCSLASNTCSFEVTVSGSGPNTGVDCNISFTAGASHEYCGVIVQVSDGAGGNIAANVNISIYPPMAAISAGFQHNCGITTAGGVKCWGNNYYGAIGDNTTTSRSTPVDVVGLSSGVAEISGGGYHTCALTTAGGVKCWGYNAYGQLGDNTTTEKHIPVDVVGLSSGVAAISAGGYNTCALTTAGGVKCWGYNTDGEVGDNTPIQRNTPVDVVGLSNGIKAISVGWDHSCALTTAGGIKCWGYNYYGQIGDNTTTSRYAPVDVLGLSSGVAAISTGGHHTCALTTAGGAKCWGHNYYGQIGDNTEADRYTPVNVYGLSSGVAAISAGWHHTSTLTTAGGVKCWGQNNYGQIGDNTTTYRLSPVDVYGLTSGMATISAGGYHVCALPTADGVKCWGYNLDGELGDNTSIDRHTPVYVIGW